MNDVVSLIGIPDNNRARVIMNTGRIADLKLSIPGTNEINDLIDRKLVPLREIALGGKRPKEIDLGRPTLVINAICEADANAKALAQAQELIENLDAGVPVLNHPENILKTTRNSVYELLHGIDGIRVPKTIRVAPRCLGDVEQLVRSGTVAAPFIFRQAGLHNGMQSLLLKTPEHLHDLEQFAFDGRDYYITEYVDFRSSDGKYRKARFFVVDGTAYPRHHIVSADWNIHSRTAIRDNPDYQAEARELLTNPGQELLKHCRAIHEILELEFFGVDCHVGDGNEMLIFEVNASMTSTSRKRRNADYLQRAHSAVKEAVTRMLEQRLQ